MPAFSTAHLIRNPRSCRIHGGPQSFRSPQDWKAVCEGNRLGEGLRAAIGIFEEGKPVSREVAYCLVQGCSKKKDLHCGKVALCLIQQSNLELVAPLGDPLIRLFSAHGELAAACQVFSSIKVPGSHSWHAIISAHVSSQKHRESIDLFCRMLDHALEPSKFMIACILKSCVYTTGLEQGMILHNQILESSFETEDVVCGILISLYAKCRCLEESRRVLDCLKSKNIVSCNTLISGYVHHGEHSLAWELFEEMQSCGILPDHYTFSCILKACGASKSVSKGAHVHELVFAHGFSSDVVVGNALVDMYFKCGNTVKAQEVFDGMPQKDIVSWNTLFMGYSSEEHDLDAVMFYEKMQKENMSSTRITYLCVIKACCNISAVREGRWVHDKIIKSGLVTDVKIGSALVLMYAYGGHLVDARCVFDQLANKDDVLWCTMITAYAETGSPLKAIELYESMQYNDGDPDSASFVCILKACSNLKALSHGKAVHDHLLLCGLEYDSVLRNSLITMYSKCGKVIAAVELFEDFPNRNLVSWNAMMTGYAQNELGFPALGLFEKMLGEGLKPDNVSFLSALKASACSGAIFQGRLLHDLLNRGRFGPDTELDHHLIDMYAKCGSLEEACRVYELARVKHMPSWGSFFLFAGHVQKDVESLTVCGPDAKQKDCPSSNVVRSTCDGRSKQTEEGSKCVSSLITDLSSHPPSSLAHYNCVIDNLGRTGCVNDAERLLKTMPFCPDVFGWMSVLTACKTYGYSRLGQQCREKILLLKPGTCMLEFVTSPAETDIR